MSQKPCLVFCKAFLIFLLGDSVDLFAQNISPTDPGARWGHVLVHDPEHNQILLFGGARNRGVYLSDTWLWEKGEWRRVNVDGPSARGFSAVTFHEKRKTVVLHGGRGDGRVTNSDTWEWNGFQWTQLESNEHFPADHHQMVYLPNEDKILAFGGWTGGGVSDETWIWTGQWAKADIHGPNHRASFGMAYHSGAGKVILYGGLWINGQYADLWEWSDNEWLQKGGPYDQSSLDHHAMVYDSHTERVVLFGGKNYRNQMQRNTLSIDNGGFKLLSSDGPSPRHSVGFTFDSAAGTGYLYGGKEYRGEEQVALKDFWKWNGSEWIEIRSDSRTLNEKQ